MDNIILSQLEMLKKLEFKIDNNKIKDFTEDFSEVIFKKDKASKILNISDEKTFIFEDYIIKPFPGFDFHVKFNKNVVTPFKFMKGIILKETERMYYIRVKPNIVQTFICASCLKKGNFNFLCYDCKNRHKNIDKVSWEGWIPKKSCKLGD